MSPEDVLKELEDIRAQTLDRLASLSQAQLDAQPPRADAEQPWSLGEVFMHIAIDEIYLREMLSRPLLEGIRPPAGITFLPPPPPYGASKEIIQFWFARARSQTRAYVQQWPSKWDPDLKHAGSLQLMNALQWLEGYGGHEKFHHRQIDSLIKWCNDNDAIRNHTSA
jgi:hypothetical protein